MEKKSYLVRRPFRAAGREYVTGDIFEGDATHLRKLIEQRYLTEDPAEVPVLPPIGAPVASPPPAPEAQDGFKRGPGRPRKE